jgi:DNA-binding NtrC family response regulator
MIEARQGPARRILLVEDDDTHATLMGECLSTLNAEISHVRTNELALEALGSTRFDLVVLDLALPDGHGFAVQDGMRGMDLPPPVLFVTSDDFIDHAVRAMRHGAVDYVVKRPAYLDRLVESASRILGRGDAREHEGAIFAGSSPQIQRVRDLIERYAVHDASVLITGETGTGKELVAQELHRSSSRAEHPFVAVNCAAITSSLFESELFGSVRGAFTGAVRDRDGLVGHARGGTLLLDEISELSLQDQAKLLRFIENETFRPVGGTRDREADVRVLAAANRGLRGLVEEGSFREDLYYRLNVLEIEVPPLRERKGDVQELARSFVARFASSSETRLSDRAIEELRAHDWPGNVRELLHTIERTVIRSGGGVIDHVLIGDAGPQPIRRQLSELSPSSLIESLVRCQGNVAAVAKEYRVSTRTIQRRMRAMGIRPRDFRNPPS